MDAELPRVWLRLDISSEEGGIDVRLGSSRREAGGEIASPPVGAIQQPDWLTVGDAIPLGAVVEELGLLESQLQHFPSRWDASPTYRAHRRGGEMPATVPIFVRVAAGSVQDRYDLEVESALPAEWRQRVSVVLERPMQPTSSPRLTLPLRALIVAESPIAVLDYLRETTHWFRESLGLVEVRTSTPDDFFLERAVDLAVVEQPTMVGQFTGHRTRMVVAFTPDASVQLTPPTTVGSFVSLDRLERAAEFLQSLTHDLPLHDALAELGGGDPRPVYLVSSPAAVHDLRLTDLVSEYVDLRNEFESGVPLPQSPSPATQFHLSADGGYHIDGSNSVLGELWCNEVELPGAIVDQPWLFGRESDGLLPLAERLRNLRQIVEQQRVGPAGPATFEPTTDRDRADKRVVDLTVRRHPSVTGVDGDPVISPGTTLKAGGRYDIRVRIGQQSASSILRGSVPPIASLLPDQERGHDLDVVCFPGDFAIESSPTQPLHLPPLAPSKGAAVFHLRAPGEPGVVSARIGVYHETNLVQSFLVTATVTADEERTDAVAGPIAVLDHHATEDWGNLDRLGARSLSILVNSTGTTHRVYALGGSTPAEWSLPPNVQGDIASPLRDVLEGAIDLPPTEQLVDLAKAGRTFLMRLFSNLGRQPAARELLRSIRDGSNEVVQIVRADTHQSLPWALAYDWPIRNDAATACFGWIDDETPCEHDQDSGIVCIRGFWGIRHLVEELVGSPESPPLDVQLHDSRLAIDVSAWTKNDFIDALIEDASAMADVDRVTASDSLLGRIWDPDRAPIYALIGHFEEGAIVTGTQEGTLRSDDIDSFSFAHGDLENPNPLVMLLACESGKVTPNDTASHALALIGAGVAGLVATECSVWTSQVQVFGTELLRSITSTIDASPDEVPFPMASAVREARLAMATDHMIAGLAFICFGPATLRFVTAS